MGKEGFVRQGSGLLDFSIQNGRNRFQQKNIEARKLRNAIDEERRIFEFGKGDGKKPEDRMVFDSNLNSNVQKTRKEIVPFQFSDTKVSVKNDISASSHDEYVKSNDNSVVLNQVYQDKLRDNASDLKNNLNKN